MCPLPWHGGADGKAAPWAPASPIEDSMYRVRYGRTAPESTRGSGITVNHIVTPASILAAGYHAPLAIALPIIAAVVILRAVFSKARGRPALAGKIVVRCSKGHVFPTTWSPLGSFTAIRLGAARFQRCPVGNHWALVKPVDDSDLTDNDRQDLAAQERD